MRCPPSQHVPAGLVLLDIYRQTRSLPSNQPYRIATFMREKQHIDYSTIREQNQTSKSN